jgi:hypothetical protein
MRRAILVTALALIGTLCAGQVPRPTMMSKQAGDQAPAAQVGGHSASPPHRQALIGPRRFRGAHFDRALLADIRRQMRREANFSDRFSTSGLSCGIACYTYFLVDRRNGDVFDITGQLDIGLPNDTFDIDDLHTRRGSDIAVVRYMNIRGDEDRCFTRSFRWGRNAFTPISRLRPSQCPPR